MFLMLKNFIAIFIVLFISFQFNQSNGIKFGNL